jgi:hypothetical protein
MFEEQLSEERLATIGIGLGASTPCVTTTCELGKLVSRYRDENREHHTKYLISNSIGPKDSTIPFGGELEKNADKSVERERRYFEEVRLYAEVSLQISPRFTINIRQESQRDEARSRVPRN